MTGVLQRIGWRGVSTRIAPTFEAPKCKYCDDEIEAGETSCLSCREDDAVRRMLQASYLQTPAPSRRGRCILDGKKVLVVMGDRVMTRVLSTRLRDFGCNVTCSWDAAHALATARRVEPDVILIDQSIPGGDRLTILDRLRNLACVAFTPVVVLTDDTPEISRMAILRGASACFPRVGRLEGLTAVLREFVD